MVNVRLLRCYLPTMHADEMPLALSVRNYECTNRIQRAQKSITNLLDTQETDIEAIAVK